MSHFTVTVALSANTLNRDELRTLSKETRRQKIEDAVAEALQPFDENVEVEPYVRYTVADIAADERYQECLAKHPEVIPTDWYGGTLDAEGNVLSTYNPQAQWDWWVIGGRWGGYWVAKTEEFAARSRSLTRPSAFGLAEGTEDPLRIDAGRIADIEPESLRPTFAYVDLDGTWHQKGEMLWFGFTRDEQPEDAWSAAYLAWIQGLPADTWLVNVDCHI